MEGVKNKHVQLIHGFGRL